MVERKRPSIDNAVHVMRVLTGEADDDAPVAGDPAHARPRRPGYAASSARRGLLCNGGRALHAGCTPFPLQRPGGMPLDLQHEAPRP